MTAWMPRPLRSVLVSLWQSSEPGPKSSTSEKPLVGNRELVYGSDLYNDVREDERKQKLAEDDEDFRRKRDYITDY